MAVPNPFHIGAVPMPPHGGMVQADGVMVSVEPEDQATTVDPKTGAIKTELEDGSVVVSFARPKPKRKSGKEDFYKNLVDDISDMALSQLTNELVQGIESDVQSVSERNADLAEGISMLGLKLEAPSSDPTSAGTPTEGMSRVFHPILNEAILRFQATSSGELLPAEGPVKIENAGDDQGEESDDIADALEKAMNLFFTKTASEYRPDTLRMLYDVGFSGSGFKKCYICPIRRRPVSESIAAKHFVVSNAARDLRTCGRKTHIIEMDGTTFRRMQILGVYRDLTLSDPQSYSTNPVDVATNEAMGTNPQTAQPKDRPRTLYETYAECDIEGYEDKDKSGDITGLRLPYRVTIDKDSKEILEVRRNWDEQDTMKLESRVFVKYPFVEALGFYGIGLFQILGNIARLLTAGWRITADGGMFSNFPGFLIDQRAARQLTNEFRVPPGGSAKIEVPTGMSIQDVVTGLPYKDASAPFMTFLDAVGKEGKGVGGTADLPVGEGRQDAPVGTTLALLEQATKITDAVHKGLHAAQAEEFQIMKELFEEDPEALWRHSPRESDSWDKDKIIAGLKRCDIVPRADPNTPSHVHRIMKVQALVSLAQAAPAQFDLPEICELAVRTLGFSDTKRYMAKPQAGDPAQSDPTAQAKLIGAQADLQDSQTKAADLSFKMKNSATEDQNRDLDRQANMQIANTKLRTEQVIHASKQQGDFASQVSEQQHERTLAAMEQHGDQQAAQIGAQTAANDQAVDLHKHNTGLASDHVLQASEHEHTEDMAENAQKHATGLAKMKPKPAGKPKK